GATLGPLLVTGALALGLGWRAAYLTGVVVMAGLLLGFTLTRRKWGWASEPRPGEDLSAPRDSLPWALLIATLGTFFVYVGVEAGNGAWTFSHLVGMGSSQALAGVTVSVYWGALTAGRLLMAGLGPRFPTYSMILASC